MQFTSQQRKIADQIISAFENSTTKIQYAYCENLKDGRGFTAGRAGFCTATGDLYEVVKLYSKSNPDNALSECLDTLKQLAEDEDDDVSGLEDFKKSWNAACEDHDFLDAQDAIVEKEYLKPALNYCEQNGLQTAVAALCLYDACIQHGDGDDGDSLGSLISKTNKQTGGNPKQGMNENEWLACFLAVRRADLLHPENKDTQEEWAESVGRVDALLQIVKSGNMNLDGAIAFNAYGDDYQVTA
jgi:chitosanase